MAEGPIGAVLLGHGSARGRCAADGLRAVGERLSRRLAGRAIVRVAFFEFLAPDLAAALTELEGCGCRDVVILPYFLFDGKEVRIEIPALVETLAAAHPRLRLTIAQSLGVDDRLVEILVERVEQALRGQGLLLPLGGRLPVRGEAGAVGVVLVNRGSRARYDDGTRLRTLCAQLAVRLGVPVEPAQAERSEELTIERAVDRLIDQGRERIVVVPYLHFPGKVLAVNVVPPVRRLALRYPEHRFYLARPLCLDDRLVALCADRFAEARSEGG